MSQAAAANRPSFTLRFRRERTHRALRLTANLLGVSMNELAEAAIEHELAVLGTDLEERLEHTAELLRSYRGEGLEEDVDAFARSEVEHEDPLRSRRVGSKPDDAFGIGALFAHPVER